MVPLAYSSNERSRELFRRARQVIPGGVNSPVRAFRAVQGEPPFIARAEGAYVFDVDGRRYIDYVGSWGPMILGHAHPDVVAAVKTAAEKGTSYGAPTPAEVEMAELIVAALPGVEMVRLVNSGTEAVMSAIRLARAFTGRDKIIKFAGCYHGHADAMLVAAGSGALTLGVPSSPGVPAQTAAHTIVVGYNRPEEVEAALRNNPGQVAAVIVEPVAGNMGVVAPQPGFLEELRRLTAEHGALLIFDEVITGFRVGYGGAQALYGVIPDLTCLGKIIGGGLPVGAYGGRREIMEQVSPSGPVYQAGTLSGNPLATAAGIATLRILGRSGVYEELERKAALLDEGIGQAARAAGVPVSRNRVGSMMSTFFTAVPVTDFETAMTADTACFARFFHALLERGVYIAPAQFEAMFVSLAHTEEDIARTVDTFEAAFRAVS